MGQGRRPWDNVDISGMRSPAARCKMAFDNDIIKKVGTAVAAGQRHLLYVMVSADDGGQTFEMKCKICGEFGSILARSFDHGPGCPVAIE